LNSASPEYKSKALLLDPTSSVSSSYPKSALSSCLPLTALFKTTLFLYDLYLPWQQYAMKFWVIIHVTGELEWQHHGDWSPSSAVDVVCLHIVFMPQNMPLADLICIADGTVGGI
jgi:hypothetical protein